MSAAISSTTGRPYGVALVCQVWAVPRSTYYAQASGQATEATEPKRRGPQPGISDEALLAAIKNDLERSPFVGVGGEAEARIDGEERDSVWILG